MTWFTLPLLINVLVLIPVTLGIYKDASWARRAYGSSTPARRILLSMYGAILVLSAVLLVVPMAGVAVGLLAMQVLYKLSTPFSVGTVRHPVVLSNLAIAVVHGAVLGGYALAQ